jgi:hypothetical protein
MAKGYPSRKRARKAYWRGVKVAKTGRGMNPYRHPVLKELFDRGRLTAPTRGIPPAVMRPKPVTGPRSADRSSALGWSARPNPGRRQP